MSVSFLFLTIEASDHDLFTTVGGSMGGRRHYHRCHEGVAGSSYRPTRYILRAPFEPMFFLLTESQQWTTTRLAHNMAVSSSGHHCASTGRSSQPVAVQPRCTSKA